MYFAPARYSLIPDSMDWPVLITDADREEPMRFFRSRRLRLNLLFLLLVLLNAGPFGFDVQPGIGNDEKVIHAARCPGKLGPPSPELEIEDGFDVIHASAVTIYRKPISRDFLSETSFDPLSAHRLASPCRGSPRPIVML